MFFTLPGDAQNQQAIVQDLLDKHNPMPGPELNRLSGIAVRTPVTDKRYADFRRTLVDIDDLFCDMRWAVGHALLLVRAFPTLSAPKPEPNAVFDRIGMPNRAWHLLRPLMVERERIFYSDLLETRTGGSTVAGWMLHMLVDQAVTHSVAALDRLSQLLLFVANVPAPRGRMYFRSGKLALLVDKHRLPLPPAIISLASSEEVAFLIDYRDGLAHTERPITPALRTPPVDEFMDAAGEFHRTAIKGWTPWELVGIGLMGLETARSALSPVADFCDLYVPVDGVGGV